MYYAKYQKIAFVAILILIFGALLGLTTSQTQNTQELSPRAAFAPAGITSYTSAFAGDVIGPVTVNMSEIPANLPSENNMYDRWLRGEIDINEKEYRASEQQVIEFQLDALSLPPNSNIQPLDSGPGLRAPTPGIAFDSMDTIECCGGGATVPPDPEMAAGPNHLIAVVNTAIEIYDKTGVSLLGPITSDSFFASLPPCVAGPYGTFDPNVVYDEEADRWVIADDGNGTHYCIGVSQTNDPTGAYNLYAVPAQPVGGEFHDYPHTGVGDSYIVVGANQFGGGIPGGFEGRVWALDKSVMYSGGALTPVTFSLGFEGTPQPLHLHGFSQGTWPSLGATHYVVTDPYDGCTINIWEWNIPAAPTIISTIDLCAATGVTGGFPVDAPQMGGGNIQANDWRERGFEYRNGSGWITDSISCNPGGGTVNCVRWTEVDLSGTPSLVQAGVFGDATHRTFPDLAVNSCGDMAIGYTKTSTSMFPGIWYTGRESSDPLGTLQAEAQLKAGEVTYSAFDGAPYRWGDYTGMTIDPDGTTFWYLGEYSKNIVAPANWGTYIGSFSYPNCTAGGGNPSIVLTKTVGTDPGICATTDAITITYGTTDVTYCYTVENNGDVALNYHDLVDTELGTILDNFNFTLAPSATVFLTQTVTIMTSTVNTATWTAVSELAPYTVDDTIPYDFVDISATGTSFVLGDDQVSGALPLGFTFSYFGSNYTDIYASSNGFVTFLSGQSSGCCTGQVIPTPGNPDGLIAGWWEDLDPGEPGAGLYYETQGTTPNQVFILQFTNVQHWPSGTPVTFQYKLFEGSDIIEVHYQDATSDGGTHSVGIENETGTAGLQYYRGTTGLSTPIAIQYTLATVYEASATDSASVTVLIPEISAAPGTMEVGIAPDNVLTETLDISNVREGDLIWNIDEAVGQDALISLPASDGDFQGELRIADTSTGNTTLVGVLGSTTPGGVNQLGWTAIAGGTPAVCSTPSDVPWLNVNPSSGTTVSGDTTSVAVGFDSTGLSTGVYTGTLCISSNDPATPLVTVPVTLTVETPSYGVLVSDSALAGNPGETVTHTVYITNTSNSAETFDLSIASAWTTNAPGSISLGIGETGMVQVTVDIPAGTLAGDSDTATLTATSQNDPGSSDSGDVTTMANAVYGVSLSGNQSDTGDPGTTVSYVVSITNLGNTTDTFDLSANGVWNASLPASVTLGAGESTTFVVDVDIPASANEGDSDVTAVTATSQSDPSATDSTDLTTTAVISGFEIYLPIVNRSP